MTTSEQIDWRERLREKAVSISHHHAIMGGAELGYFNLSDLEQLISEERQRVIELVEKEVIGEDEDDNIYDQWGAVGSSSQKRLRNQLKAEQRQKLAQLEKGTVCQQT